MSALAELKTPWADPETVAEMEKLWRGGFSASQIAARLNKRSLTTISRNMVIGKLTRMGLSGRGQNTPRVTKVKRGRTSESYQRASQKAAKTRKVMTEARAKPLFVETYIMPPEPPESTPEAATSFMDLRNDQCRWPYGDREFKFCPEPKMEMQSYCAGHARKAYQPLPPRKVKA